VFTEQGLGTEEAPGHLEDAAEPRTSTVNLSSTANDLPQAPGTSTLNLSSTAAGVPREEADNSRPEEDIVMEEEDAGSSTGQGTAGLAGEGVHARTIALNEYMTQNSQLLS
jgi:hypothetical protein